MNTTIRREILAKLHRVGELDPDVRFGQLVANLATMSAGPWDRTLWDLEDEQMLDALNQLIGMLSSRTKTLVPEAIAG